MRRGLLQRLSIRLAESYSDQIQGKTIGERMESLAELFRARQIPFEVRQDQDQLPVLTALACPYPELAEKDATICAMERLMFSELLGEKVNLDRCRLDGDSCCTFRGSDVATTTQPADRMVANPSQSAVKLRR